MKAKVKSIGEIVDISPSCVTSSKMNASRMPFSNT